MITRLLASQRRQAVLVGAVAVLAALAASAATGRFGSLDRWEYSIIADHILAGDGAYYDYMGIRYYFYGPPLYPLLLAGVVGLTGSEVVVLVLQACILAGTATILHTVAWRLWDPRVALLGGLLVALHPPSLIYAGQLHSQTLDVFVIAAAFLLWLGIHAASIGRAFATGIALAGAVLSRGTMGPVVLAWGLRFVWRCRRDWRRATTVGVAVAAGGALVVLPLIVRGYRLYGEWTPLRTDAGVNLWYGNHDGSTGTAYSGDPVPVPVTTHLTTEDRRIVAGMNEIEQNEYFTARVRRWIESNPGTAATLFVNKLRFYWWTSPHTGLHYPAAWTRVYLVYYSVVLALGIFGLWRAMRAAPLSREAARLFIVMAVCASVTQAAFYVEGRHRWQLEPMLLLFTAYGAVTLARRSAERRRSDGGSFRPRVQVTSSS